MKGQRALVFAVVLVALALFVLYLGFMTQYYVLFYDGTMETFEYYKTLQIFNKQAFGIAVIFVILAFTLIVFALHKYRPGLVGLIVVLGVTGFMIVQSLALMSVIPKYKRNYLALDISSMEEYVPTTFVFDAAMILQATLIGVSAILIIVAFATFVQRLREGNPIIRKAVII
jgi:hypothetical protein